MTEAGSKDVPEHCPKCKQTTLFREDREGTYHCLRCLAGAIGTPTATIATAQPSAVNVTVKGTRKSVMTETIKLAGFIAALIFFGILASCIYCAAQVGKATSEIKDGAKNSR